MFSTISPRVGAGVVPTHPSLRTSSPPGATAWRSGRPAQRPTRRGGAAAAFNGTWRRPQPAEGSRDRKTGPGRLHPPVPLPLRSRSSPGPHAWRCRGREPPTRGGRTRGPLAPWRRGREPRGAAWGCVGPPGASSEGRRLPLPRYPRRSSAKPPPGPAALPRARRPGAAGPWPGACRRSDPPAPPPPPRSAPS